MICFRIFERHYVTSFDDNLICFRDKKDGWVRFNYCFDPGEKTIMDFIDFPLFDDDGEFIANTTKVNFSDGTYIISCNSFEWFVNNVVPEYQKHFENNKPENQ